MEEREREGEKEEREGGRREGVKGREEVSKLESQTSGLQKFHVCFHPFNKQAHVQGCPSPPVSCT